MCLPTQVLPLVARQLWQHLRLAVLHYTRPTTDSNPFSAAGRQQAKDSMFKYASLLEEHRFPNYMFTWNLHWGVCRLPQQEITRGSTGRDAEWWTERLMQYYKQLVGDRVSHKTEQVGGHSAAGSISLSPTVTACLPCLLSVFVVCCVCMCMCMLVCNDSMYEQQHVCVMHPFTLSCLFSVHLSTLCALQTFANTLLMLFAVQDLQFHLSPGAAQAAEQQQQQQTPHLQRGPR